LVRPLCTLEYGTYLNKIFPLWEKELYFPNREERGVMRVIGRDKLLRFSKKHNQAKTALDSWFAEAERVVW